jgi:hypothetical protein
VIQGWEPRAKMDPRPRTADRFSPEIINPHPLAAREAQRIPALIRDDDTAQSDARGPVLGRAGEGDEEARGVVQLRVVSVYQVCCPGEGERG